MTPPYKQRYFLNQNGGVGLYEIPVTETQRDGDIVAERERPLSENFHPRADNRS